MIKYFTSPAKTHRTVLKFAAKLCTFLIIVCSISCNICQSHKGKVEHIINFSSKHVPARNIDIWLPPAYSSDKKYCVLYMHDGQMLFDSTTTWNKQEWMVDETIEKLISEEKIQETIVVGIHNIKELRTIEYFPNKAYQKLPQEIKDKLSTKRLKTEPKSDHYLKFITQELKPYIDESYSTYKDAQHTFIAGSSMGGLISMYAICEYPDIFGGAACISTHWPGDKRSNIAIPTAFRDYMETNLPSADAHKFYFDHGTEKLDSIYKPYQLMIDTVMLKKGYSNKNWISKEFEGHAHVEKSWASRLHIPLEFLLTEKK